jgi:hypothetical protein
MSRYATRTSLPEGRACADADQQEDRDGDGGEDADDDDDDEELDEGEALLVLLGLDPGAEHGACLL